MTRDEWIKMYPTICDMHGTERDGATYDLLCRLIASRIAAALEKRDAEAIASANAAWSAKEHADAAALAAKSAEPPTYSRREPVAEEDRPPTGERFGARIHNSSKDGKFLVDVSSASLCCTGRWYYYAGERGKGNFLTESEARAALATAPPPLGWVETAKAVKEVTRDELTEYLNTFMAGQPTQKHADAIMARFTLTRKPAP